MTLDIGHFECVDDLFSHTLETALFTTPQKEDVFAEIGCFVVVVVVVV